MMSIFGAAGDERAATAATKMSCCLLAIVASVTQAIMLALSTRRHKLTAVHVWLDNKNSAARGERYYHVGASSFC
jgi:hypothetical protein